MGHTFSQSKRKQEHELKKHKQKVAQTGILIPPSFGTCTGPIPTPSTGSSGKSCVVEPCSVPHLWVHSYTASPVAQFIQRQSHLSHRLLGSEHTQSGVWIRASPIGNEDDTTVLASLFSPRISSCFPQPILPTAGSISLARVVHHRAWHAGAGIRALAQVGTNESSISTGGAFWKYNPLNMTLFTSLEETFTKVGAIYSTDSNSIAWNSGSSFLFHNGKYQGTQSWMSLRSTGWSAGIDMHLPLTSEIAKDILRTSWPIKSLNNLLNVMMHETTPKSWQPHISYYLTYDLTSKDSSIASPLVLAVCRDSTQDPPTLSASVSQVVSFDRQVLNILEDRCPKIRNTVSWAVELTSSELEPKSSLCAAVAWQMNRNIATKVRVDQQGMTAALLVKRWAFPGLTLSILGGYKSQQPFWGLGVQLDTSLNPSDAIYAKSSVAANSGNTTPQTRVEVTSNRSSM